MFFVRAALTLFVAAAVTACGSTSDLSSLKAIGGTGMGNKAQPVSLTQYNRVVVRDFTTNLDAGSDELSVAQPGTKRFQQYITTNLQSSSAFKDVVTEKTGEKVVMTPGTLIVDGEVTRYVEGNKALRLLVGMGAGSSYFDATITMRDGVSGEAIAKSVVDLNSWGLGGGVAMEQTVDTFILSSSSKVANDIAAARTMTTEPAAGTTQASKE